METKLGCAFVFVFSCFITKAQLYHPMKTDSVTWTVVENGYGTNPPQTGVWHFGLAGDTLINSNLYSKLYCNCGSLGSANAEPVFNLQTATYYGAMREDAAKRVWFIKSPATTEYLYYDFSLNLGDSFCFNYEPCGVNCHTVSLVDSVLVNGSYRRQIHFSYGGQSEKWIEGIGSAYDPWTGYWCYTGNIDWNLNCYKEKGNIIYGPCNYPNGINEQGLGEPAVNIYPNPFTGVVKVENIKAGAVVTIINVLGETVQEFKCQSGHSLLNLESLSNGIYFLQCRQNNKESFYKLVKQ
jgi:hypothetical protein